MIEKIIDSPSKMREIIMAAQELTNAIFKITNLSMVSNKSCNKPFLNLSAENLRQKINNSALPNEDKENLSSMNDDELYIFAREIVISLARREIKNPLNP